MTATGLCERCGVSPVFGKRRFCDDCKRAKAVERARRRHRRLKGTAAFKAYQREQSRLYRANHREAVNARNRRRKQEKRDHINALRRAWYARNRERINAARRSPAFRVIRNELARQWRQAQGPGADFRRRKRMRFEAILKGVRKA